MTVRKGVSFHVLAVLVCSGLTLLACNCFSQIPKIEDRNHYKVQVQQGYPCPECGYSIPVEKISANIRKKNECPNCQKVFFGVPLVKKSQKGEQVASFGLRSHGPRSIYESDTDHQYFLVGGESFKETPTGYSFLYWSFRDYKVKSYRVIPRWTTTRYHYP